MSDNFDKLSEEFKITIPKDTIVMRISIPDRNDLGPFRYFSYWRGNFAHAYTANKLMFKGKLVDNSTVEFWKFKEDTPLVVISYYMISFEDEADEQKKRQIDEFIQLFNVLNISEEDKQCYINALNGIYFSDLDLSTIANCEDPMNPDNILAHMFTNLDLRGWVRIAYKDEVTPADEIVLTNNEVKERLQFIGRISPKELLNPNFLPPFIDKNFVQPAIEPKYIAGGGDIYQRKYFKYKEKYLRLKKN